MNQVAFGLAGLVGAFVAALALFVLRALRPKGTGKGDDPLPVLRTYRMDHTLHGIKFGENANIVSGLGSRLYAGCMAKVTFDS